MTPYERRLNPLVKRMAEDMLVRNLSPSTIDSYTYQVDKFRPYGETFLVVYFLLAIALLGCVAAEWYCQLDHSWTILITLISAWAVRSELWATTVGNALANARLPQ